ncbi:hypothetical protein JL722_5843 [Aureococcus anophagefferens]|nr:hypothetical protein JL722_5843 [Aureococcus anophagefferens]
MRAVERAALVAGWLLALVLLVERSSAPGLVVRPAAVARPAPAPAPPVPARGAPGAPRAPSRYADPAFASGPSKVECYRFGAPVDPREPEECHAGPPFWNWWLMFRNCVVTNACLRRGVLTLHSGGGDPAAGPLPPREAGAPPPPLACNNWGRGAECYGAVYARGAPPAPGPRGDGTLVRWFDEPALHSARILPGHFGHDVLNNYSTRAPGPARRRRAQKTAAAPQVFNTMWEANLTHLLDAGSLTHVVDDTVASPFGDRLVRSVAYTPNPAQDKSDATSLQLLPGLRGGVGGRGRGPAALANSCASRRGAYRILVAVRTHDPGSSSFLFANGRGRRVVNVDALVAALAPLGDVEAFDPGLLPLGDQIRKAASADVLSCRDVCAGPPEFRIYIGFPTIKQCQDRCDAFALRLSKLETAPDAYFKPEWYKNWWLGDAEADVPAVVALVSEHLGCA